MKSRQAAPPLPSRYLFRYLFNSCLRTYYLGLEAKMLFNVSISRDRPVQTGSSKKLLDMREYSDYSAGRLKGKLQLLTLVARGLP